MTEIAFDIGLDVDDVLFPWSRLIHEACEVAGITNGNCISQWEAWLDYGCTEAEFWEVVHAAYRGGLLRRANPLPYVRAAVGSLRARGHRIHLVTARGFEGPLAEQVREDTKAWVHWLGMDVSSLRFEKDKTRVPTDYFLDDSIPNVTALRAAGVEAFLHDQDHNASDTTLPRVKNITEFANLVIRECELMAECK